MNVMSMDYIFTEIDARSYDAVVRNGWISEVLLAMLVDPLEADDMANSILRRKESSIELYVNGRVFDAPISLEDFHDLPSKHAFEKLKITMSQWVMTNDRADNAVRMITMWNIRFGVWCACAAAREALQFIPEGELRPLLAIEAAEAWVRGRATGQRVAAGADAAYAASYAAARAVDAADVDAYTASAEAAADAAAEPPPLPPVLPATAPPNLLLPSQPPPLPAPPSPTRTLRSSPISPAPAMQTGDLSEMPNSSVSAKLSPTLASPFRDNDHAQTQRLHRDRSQVLCCHRQERLAQRSASRVAC